MSYVIFVAFKEHFIFYFKVLTLLYMRRPGLGAGAGNERAVGCVQLQDLHFGLQDFCVLCLFFWDYF